MRILLCAAAAAILLAACSNPQPATSHSDPSSRSAAHSPDVAMLNAPNGPDVRAAGHAAPSEPGPEDHGLRLRLTATPRAEAAATSDTIKEEYNEEKVGNGPHNVVYSGYQGCTIAGYP